MHLFSEIKMTEPYKDLKIKRVYTVPRFVAEFLNHFGKAIIIQNLERPTMTELTILDNY